ncbi:hypothetical protein D3C75_1314280 [compost metagenome]
MPASLNGRCAMKSGNTWARLLPLIASTMPNNSDTSITGARMRVGEFHRSFTKLRPTTTMHGG